MDHPGLRPLPALPGGPQLAGQPAVYLLRHENPARMYDYYLGGL
jgi:hypothetical protein